LKEEITVRNNLGNTLLALALVALPGAAQAQTVITRDAGLLQLTPNQRATIYRTIVPQGRGRAPIVRERIEIEPVVPTVRERVITRPLDSYAYDTDAYAYVPRPRVGVPPDAYGDYAYVGGRVPPSVRAAPFPQTLVTDFPTLRGYRYVTLGNRILLVDPSTNMIVGELTD
jgi:hypothetical protein